MAMGMTILIIAKLNKANGDLYLKADELRSAYSTLFKKENYIRGYLATVYNAEGRIVQEPRLEVKLPVTLNYTNKIILTKTAQELGIPVYYWVELLVASLVEGEKEYPVLPNEMKVVKDYGIPKAIEIRVEERASALAREVEFLQIIAMLRQYGLVDIANELGEGLMGLERGHHDDSIKHFRNVVEGVRKITKDWSTIAGSASRAEKFKRVLNAIYDFEFMGAHIGAQPLRMDAEHGRDLTIAVLRYLMAVMPEQSR